VLIVDRGITQLAGGRYAALADGAVDALAAMCPSEAAIDVRFVPSPAVRLAVRDLRGELCAHSALPVQTRDQLLAAIEQARRDGGGMSSVAGSIANPILVLTDQSVPVPPGVILAASGRRVSNVGIAYLAATGGPAPQLMLRLRNDSPRQVAEVSVTSAGKSVSRSVKLPSAGESADVFIDLPALGETIQARVEAPDDLLADNVAYLVREGRAARPAARTVLPAELARMVEVYDRLHGDAGAASEVEVATTTPKLDASGVQLAVASGTMTGLGVVTQVDHPLLRSVTLPQTAALAASPPGTGWTVLASAGVSTGAGSGTDMGASAGKGPDIGVGAGGGGSPILAVRQTPVRQVWVGFWSARWAQQVDFVIFWTNIFDWLGGGESRFVSQAPHALEAGWEAVAPPMPPAPGTPAYPPGMSPGLYRRGDALIAVNAWVPADLNPLSPATASVFAPAARGAMAWQQQLRELLALHPARRALAPWLAVLAMALVVAAAVGQAMRPAGAQPIVHEREIRG
jgi:hypothetical protein